MCAYSKHYRIEILMKRKQEILNNLQGAVLNGDGELVKKYDIKLKAVLKQLKKLKQEDVNNFVKDIDNDDEV